MTNQEINSNNNLFILHLIYNFTSILRIVNNDFEINDLDKKHLIHQINDIMHSIANQCVMEGHTDLSFDIQLNYFKDQLEAIKAKYQKPLKMMNLIHSYL